MHMHALVRVLNVTLVCTYMDMSNCMNLQGWHMQGLSFGPTSVQQKIAVQQFRVTAYLDVQVHNFVGVQVK